jgi:hypothetical protein
LDNGKAWVLIEWFSTVDLKRLLPSAWVYAGVPDEPRLVWHPGKVMRGNQYPTPALGRFESGVGQTQKAPGVPPCCREWRRAFSNAETHGAAMLLKQEEN